MISLAFTILFTDNQLGKFMVMKHYLVLVSKAVLAGLYVAIAGVIYLALYPIHKIIGAMLFSFALLLVVAYNLNLYTGKIGYLFNHRPRYLVDILFIIIGNSIGAILIALIVKVAELESFITTAKTLSTAKIETGYLPNFGRAILCGMMMYLAVDGYKRIHIDVLRVIVVIFAVMIFILAGFEHSVANMFYFSVSGALSWRSLLVLMVMLLGNGVGAIILNLLEKIGKLA